MVKIILLLSLVAAAVVRAGEYYRVVDMVNSRAKAHSRDPNWKPDRDQLALEVTGIAALDHDAIAIAIRKGEIWILDHATAQDPKSIGYRLFASGLDEPLGLLRDGDDLLTTQRSELTRLQDSNQDGFADTYLTINNAWNVSGAYHGYAYGPVRDGSGNLWVTLNLDMGEHSDNSRPWRGWALRLSLDGTSVEPMAAGLRSPCGLATNVAGDVFATDQQGQWVPTNSLVHLREGAYFGNPDGMAPATLPDSKVAPLPESIDVSGKPYPEALALLPKLRAPAVWFPYLKMGQSRTNLCIDTSKGQFGPYAGQFFVGEFTQSKIGRVFLEKVDGEYQGACFPFLEGFPSAVMSLAFGEEGTLFAGMTNRGWSSIGGGSYGLQRIHWTGKTPFELLAMRAKPDGFELEFTREVDPAGAREVTNYHISSYTCPLHASYGGEEILTEPLEIRQAIVSKNGRRVRLVTGERRCYFVYELHYETIRSASGERPWHDRAYYTLNRVPSPETGG